MSDETIWCPWCGHEVAQGDLCDYDADGSSHETTCEECEQPITYTGEVWVVFTTTKGGPKK